MYAIAVTSWSEKRDERDVIEINRSFVDGVLRAGGTPLVFPVLEPALASAALTAVSGLVLTGGIDVDPSFYGADRSPHVTLVDERRDAFEVALVDAAVARGVPVLGLCRGAQVLNVARGGTLIQHLPDVSDQPHDVREALHSAVHPVRVRAGSLLADVVDRRPSLQVNSLHHQAVDDLGEDLEASAWSEDEVIEAIEDRSRGLLGVQWHPELMLDHPDGHLALFEWLVEAAGKMQLTEAG